MVAIIIWWYTQKMAPEQKAEREEARRLQLVAQDKYEAALKQQYQDERSRADARERALLEGMKDISQSHKEAMREFGEKITEEIRKNK